EGYRANQEVGVDGYINADKVAIGDDQAIVGEGNAHVAAADALDAAELHKGRTEKLESVGRRRVAELQLVGAKGHFADREAGGDGHIQADQVAVGDQNAVIGKSDADLLTSHPLNAADRNEGRTEKLERVGGRRVAELQF